jgi:enoyl-CoA hydratase/carnithine racemase
VEGINKMAIKKFQTSPAAFSAGLDMKELLNPDAQRLKELRATYIDCCIKLYGSLFPTAAAINGVIII